MKLQKEEILLANGFNQFNLVDENNLIVGVVAGFTNEQNLKTATLFENAPELLEALRTCYASLCTYGSHPIIEKQVENVLRKIK